MADVDAIAVAGEINIVAAFQLRRKRRHSQWVRPYGFCSDQSAALTTNCLVTVKMRTKFHFEVSLAWTWLHSKTCYITSNVTSARTEPVCSSLLK